MYDDSDVFLNNVGVAFIFMGAIGRLGWGLAGEYLPNWVLLILGDGASVLFQVLMYYSRTERIGYVIVCGFLAVTTGVMNIIPPIIKRDIGEEDLALDFGLILIGAVVGCIWYMFCLWMDNMSDLLLVWIVSVPTLVSLLGDIVMLGTY